MPLIHLDQLPEKEIAKGYFARTVHTGKMSLVFWRIEAGDALPQHSHLHEQVVHLMKGKFELTVDGEAYLLEPGMVFVVPSHTLHGGRAITDCEMLDVFYPEREDYKF